MASSPTNEKRVISQLVLKIFCFLGGLALLNAFIMVETVGHRAFKPLGREVASLSKPPKEEIIGDTLLIPINCELSPQPLSLQTKASMVRLLFENCPRVGRPLNPQNQSQGDLFQLSKNQWTSDFIFLSEGQNRLEMKLGKNKQIIEINRENKKSPQS